MLGQTRWSCERNSLDDRERSREFLSELTMAEEDLREESFDRT